MDAVSNQCCKFNNFLRNIGKIDPADFPENRSLMSAYFALRMRMRPATKTTTPIVTSTIQIQF